MVGSWADFGQYMKERQINFRMASLSTKRWTQYLLSNLPFHRKVPQSDFVVYHKVGGWDLRPKGG